MADKKPLILLVNDDGYKSKALITLAGIASNYGNVAIVAPDTEMSGMSHAISTGKDIRVRSRDIIFGVDSFHVCTGTPVDCVKIGLHKILDTHPDLILSGINYGLNAAACTHYSGTVAAAREGALHGIPSIAFSSGKYYDIKDDLSYCTDIISGIIANVLIAPRDRFNNFFLNVNIPDLPPEKIKGIKVCRLNKGYWEEEFNRGLSFFGQNRERLGGQFINTEPDAEDTDEAALRSGYVAISPVTIDITDYKAVEMLNRFL